MSKLKTYAETYITMNTRAAQDKVMIFTCELDILSREGRVVVYNRTWYYQCLQTDSRIFRIKVILLESGLQMNATIIKYKDELEKLPELIGKKSSNVLKFNS